MNICIDSGHGGKDPGTHYGDINEKDITLKVSLYQFKRFKELGFKPYLTRDKDITLVANTRTELVKAGGAKICLSNHLNSGGGQGAETIYSVHSNGQLALSILKAIESEGMATRKAYTRRSSTGQNIDYYFMHRNTKPIETVIVEYGFLDNTKDRELILAKWEKLAEAVVKAICSYVNIKYVPPVDSELVKALDKLKDSGIISSPEYWLENANKDKTVKGEYAATLIKNMAKKL